MTIKSMKSTNTIALTILLCIVIVCVIGLTITEFVIKGTQRHYEKINRNQYLFELQEQQIIDRENEIVKRILNNDLQN